MIILYPSYSFETLSTDRTKAEARQLLAAWTSAFHPALLEKFKEIPRWESASIPPYSASKQPLVVPPCCESYMEEDWFRQQQEGGAVLIRNKTRREEILPELLTLAGAENHGFDDAFVADFYALGTAYFLVELLVRQLHYMTMMDDSQCSTQIFEAIRAYRENDAEKTRDHLRQAFEAVCQSKEYFFPIRSYFLDLTLLTPTTVGGSFRRLLGEGNKTNLFLSSGLLKTLPDKEPESFQQLRSACEADRVRLIADDTEEKSLLLLPILDIADRILEGLSIYRDLLNVSPKIYGRLYGVLTPILPQLLKLTGMNGAVHFAPLDGWRIKEDAQSKMIWQGVDGTKLDALVRYPLDGSSDLDFFALASRLGETINNDQAPTAVFARFPTSPDLSANSWLENLRRMGRYTEDLGEFLPIDSYFESTSQCGGVEKFGFGKYPVDVLSASVDAGESDPITQWNKVYAESVRRTIRSAFETVQGLLGRKPSDEALAGDFAAALSVSNDSGSQGIFLANPWSFPRRVFLDVSHWKTLPGESGPVVLARQSEDRKEIVVDIPPLGYAFVEPASGGVNEDSVDSPESSTSPRKRSGLFGLFKKPKSTEEPPMIVKTEDEVGKNVKRNVFLMRNEHFEAKFDATTGILRSVFTNHSRFNRLSRQIGFRQPKSVRLEDPRSASDPNRGYAIMAADDIRIESAGPVSGRLNIRGRLVAQDGDVVAKFEETVTMRRRSRILEFDLLMEPKSEPGGPPWDSYYAIRYAWNDNTMDLRACLADGMHAISADRLHAPRIVDLRGEGKQALTFLSEGLPFHRRFGERQMDTILISGNETARRFRFGIGIDVPYPVPASLEFLAPKDELILRSASRPKIPSAWLFQIEAKNVVALHWDPILEDDRPVGFKVFLLETEGRRAHFALHSFHAPTQAVSVDFFGEEIKERKIDGDRILLDMHGHELLPLRVHWAGASVSSSET